MMSVVTAQAIAGLWNSKSKYSHWATSFVHSVKLCAGSHVSSPRMPMNRWRGRDFRHNAKWQMFQKVTWTWHNIGVSCWHFTALHPTAGGYMSQLAVNNRQDQLDANRSRRSIGCCNSCESQAGTPFRLARLKDKPLKLCLQLLVQSFRIQVYICSCGNCTCNVSFSSETVQWFSPHSW